MREVTLLLGQVGAARRQPIYAGDRVDLFAAEVCVEEALHLGAQAHPALHRPRPLQPGLPDGTRGHLLQEHHQGRLPTPVPPGALERRLTVFVQPCQQVAFGVTQMVEVYLSDCLDDTGQHLPIP